MLKAVASSPEAVRAFAEAVELRDSRWARVGRGGAPRGVAQHGVIEGNGEGGEGRQGSGGPYGVCGGFPRDFRAPVGRLEGFTASIQKGLSIGFKHYTAA